MKGFSKSDEACRTFLEKRLGHYHIIKLNDSVSTPGRVNRNAEFPYLGLKEADFSGKSVLDIGALDGVLTFNAERLGAERCLAIDVEDPAKQDWGFSGPPDRFAALGEVKNKVFGELREFFESTAERKQVTVYDLDPDVDGRFDIVFFYGVLYHLRHPLLAFDRLRSVCKGVICVETHVCNFDPTLPAALFYGDDVLQGAESNWTGPTEACVASWMRDAGFRTIFAERKPRVASRQRFVGFVDEATFDVNENKFRLLDEDYFLSVRKRAEKSIARGKRWGKGRFWKS